MQVSYEVYTLSGGRWLLDSRYDDEAREVAIDEARQLAKRGRVEATKVVQEDYDEGTHFVRESNRLRGRALDRFNQLRSADNDGTGEPNYLGELQRNVGHDHADPNREES